MPRLACRLLSLLAVVLLMTYAPLAQTRAQNDKAAADAVKNKGLPLLTERTMSFTTSEATWLSLDLSPDGKTIVFELLGDLYTLPVTGGEATRITSGQGYDMQPAFSPDGKKLVFISDRNGSENVWVANADGTKPRAITTTERENYMSPTWAPDGEYVIAAKGAQLWMYHESGGSGVQMTGVSGGAQPAASPGPAAAAAPAILGPAFGKDPQSSDAASSELRRDSLGERARHRAPRIGTAPGRGRVERLTTIRIRRSAVRRASSVHIRSRSSIARTAACSSARTSTKGRSARFRAPTASGSSTPRATTRGRR